MVSSYFASRKLPHTTFLSLELICSGHGNKCSGHGNKCSGHGNKCSGHGNKKQNWTFLFQNYLEFEVWFRDVGYVSLKGTKW